MSTEREAFEAWYSTQEEAPGYYVGMHAAIAWCAWQAALARPTVPQGELMTAEQAHAYIDAVVTAAQEKP